MPWSGLQRRARGEQLNDISVAPAKEETKREDVPKIVPKGAIGKVRPRNSKRDMVSIKNDKEEAVR